MYGTCSVTLYVYPSLVIPYGIYCLLQFETVIHPYDPYDGTIALVVVAVVAIAVALWNPQSFVRLESHIK